MSKSKFNKKSKILLMYAGLEKITQNEGNEEIVNLFEDYFPSGTKDRNDRVLFHRDILQGAITDKHRKASVLHNNKDSPINGDTLLLRAMSINVEKDGKQQTDLRQIIGILVERCPDMIIFPKDNDDYRGITPLHLAILNEDEKLVEEMAKSLKGKKGKNETRDICASGPVFQDTVMMAGTLLGVAALKFNKNVFNRILGLTNFSRDVKINFFIDVTNNNGDNIIHSLIKFAHLNPDKISNVLEMLRYVLEYKIEGIPEKKKIRKLLMMTNKDKMNPLQLAAKRQQYQIFEMIMQHDVFHSTESGDGFFNEEVYDITEIETIPLRMIDNKPERDEDDIRPEHHYSVLEYIVHHETKNAFLFADFLPIKEVIREKWKSYRWFFMSWFAVHLLFMVVLSVAAVYRSKLKTEMPRDSTVEYSYVVTHNTFVSAVSVVGLVFGFIYLSMEVSRIIISRFFYKTSSNILKRIFRNLNSPYSNQMFRIYFVLFSLLLILDCVVAATEASGSFSGYENYCLIFAVILGWYLVMFFLQTLKAFGIFTVLIQRAVIDMLKFALVMAFFLVAFSVAMYMIMQGAETDEDDFIYFSTTMLKMLTIMLGIGDLGILFEARQPYLAIFIFVLFVLLTTILLLNALIAMMSNTCTELMSNYGGEIAAKLHCRLQKLSVILFLESCFPIFLCKEVGKITKKYRYHNNEWEKDVLRRIWLRNSVHVHRKLNDVEKTTHTLNQWPEGVITNFIQSLNVYKERVKVTPGKVDPIKTTTKKEPDVADIGIGTHDTFSCPTCNHESNVPFTLENYTMSFQDTI